MLECTQRRACLYVATCVWTTHLSFSQYRHLPTKLHKRFYNFGPEKRLLTPYNKTTDFVVVGIQGHARLYICQPQKSMEYKYNILTILLKVNRKKRSQAEKSR